MQLRRTTWIIVALVAMLALGACSPSGDTAETTASDSVVTLTDGDLSAAAQLALGTLQLEDTEQAVDETQAATLLPLWQAYQTLSQSDTTAAVELEALAGQIQRAMTAEQVQAIADMGLTADTLTALQESGDLSFGGFGRGDETTSGTTEGAAATGGFAAGAVVEGGGGGAPPGDFAAGGGPGGGGGGAMPGGGMMIEGGAMPDGGEFSEDDLATRQAAMAAMDPAEMQARMLTGMVVRLLQTKTGEMPTGGPGGGMGMGGPTFDAALTAVAEATGLSVDDIRAQAAEGETLTAIIEANGGDVAAVRAAIVEALNARPEAADMDAEAMVERMLGGGQ